jgi:GMP synthase-like glutamine amidotransferase
MKIHYLQHVPFEDVSYMGNWAKENGIHFSRIRVYEYDPYPHLSDVEALIIMGGPMGARDDQIYPWLKSEKAYIRKAIQKNKIVVGVCLGAQLIAMVLGAKVYPNPHKEIGWFPVHKTPQAHNTSIGKILPESFMAFHWHGDTFDIPKGAVRLAESKVCKNQAFVYLNRVIALQFHLESTQSSIESLIQNCRDELISAPYIQTVDQIRKGYHQIESLNTIMVNLMNFIILGSS